VLQLDGDIFLASHLRRDSRVQGFEKEGGHRWPLAGSKRMQQSALGSERALPGRCHCHLPPGGARMGQAGRGREGGRERRQQHTQWLRRGVDAHWWSRYHHHSATWRRTRTGEKAGTALLWGSKQAQVQGGRAPTLASYRPVYQPSRRVCTTARRPARGQGGRMTARPTRSRRTRTWIEMGRSPHPLLSRSHLAPGWVPRTRLCPYRRPTHACRQGGVIS